MSVYFDEDEGLDLQDLIDTGLAWRLEGAVGRATMAAIEAGAPASWAPWATGTSEQPATGPRGTYPRGSGTGLLSPPNHQA